MSILDFFLNFFKSPQQKKKESDSYEAYRIIHAMTALNLQSIMMAESSWNSESKKRAAKGVFFSAIDFDRSVIGISELTKAVINFENKGKFDNSRRHIEYAHGLTMGGRMMTAATFLDKFQGEEWMVLSLEFSKLEGALYGFMVRQGVEVWGCPYSEDFKFEEFRAGIKSIET